MRDLSMLVNATQAASEVGIPAATVWKWKERGTLEPADYDNRGRPLYHLIDVFRAERSTRANQKHARREYRREFPTAA